MLSIVIPTYNSEGCIKLALSSILSQSFVDWEVLVMDGGSVDSTVSIANSFHDDRIKVFSEPDHGVYDAMNKGIDLSQGEWLYFLGSDDYLLHNHVLESVFTHSIDVDILYGDVESPHLKREYLGEWQVSQIMYNRCHQGIFYKKWLFDRYGRYELKYRVLADRAFNLKVFQSKCQSTVSPLQQCLFFFRWIKFNVNRHCFPSRFQFHCIRELVLETQQFTKDLFH